MSDKRTRLIGSWLGFARGTTPLTYLGVPIFSGAPKAGHFQVLLDNIKVKLASWKGPLLSLMGRVQLVKSVINAKLLHIFSIYQLPRAVLQNIEEWIRNFIWSGDINSRKLMSVSWKIICRPFNEGGLGLVSLTTLNKALLSRLSWGVLHSADQWASFLRGRFFNGNNPVACFRKSSLWPGMKQLWQQLRANTGWVLGNGEKISFWNDRWLGKEPLVVQGIPSMLQHSLHATVAEFARGSLKHDLTMAVQQQHHLASALAALSCIRDEPDQPIWSAAADGVLSQKRAIDFISPPGQHVRWAFIWSKVIPPSKSAIIWRLIHNRLPTDENLSKRGWFIPSQCDLCHTHSESSDHLFFRCPFAVQAWTWLSLIFDVPIDTADMVTTLKILDRSWSKLLKEVLLAAITQIICSIWFCRNSHRYKGSSTPFNSILPSIVGGIRLAGSMSTSCMNCSVEEFSILKRLGVDLRPPAPTLIKRVDWYPPPQGFIKCNSDGAARGCPGPAGCGGIFRDHTGGMVGGFSAFIGSHSAFEAELMAAMMAIEEAHRRNWHMLWLECDSKLVTLAFLNTDLVPWRLRAKWKTCLSLTLSMEFRTSHIYREGNSCADGLATLALVHRTDFIWWNIPPSCICESLFRNRCGLPHYRFC